jgi:beta-galactosidase
MSPFESIVIGAQYYRPPNPPAEDWERDLKMMADAGMNTVKFWACWSWMNPEEGRYDFADLDRLMEIASGAGLKVVLNVILEDAPYWLEQKVPEARYADAENRTIRLGAAMNTPGGGWPGLCFDNEPVMTTGLAFLAAMVERYKDHPALLSWDVWNEPHLEPASYFPDRLYCYCDASVSAFRGWLKERYGSLDALNDRWARRFSDWNQVEPPRLFEAVPDMLDWREYWFENLKSWLKARVRTTKQVGATQPVMTHVALSGFTGQLATHTLDEWMLTGDVDGFGTSSFPTWLMADDPVEHLMNLDTARAAAAGKPFWQTELQGGRGRRDGLKSTKHPRPEIVLLEMWNALAAGARGVLFWQWRPELLGPESPGYGLCGVDGSPTERTRAASAFAGLVQRVPELADTRPVGASLGLIVSRRTALHAFATDRTMDIYRKSVMGAYRLLVDAGLPLEFIHEDEIEKSDVPDRLETLYHPMPAVISQVLAEQLEQWVAAGGRLVSEAAPGAYDERGWHRPFVPPQPLKTAFGLRSLETDAVSELIACCLRHAQFKGGWIRDIIRCDSAEPLGTFEDKSPAVTRNAHGRGEAILIATCPSVAYDQTRDVPTRLAIAELLGKPVAMIVEPVDLQPGLVMRAQMLEDGRPAVFIMNWNQQPAELVTSADVVVHTIETSTSLSAGSGWTVPPLSGALMIAK